MIDTVKSWLYDFTGDDESSRVNAVRENISEVDEALQKAEESMRSVQSWQAPLATEVVHHLVEAGGKRLRPTLVYLSYSAAGGDDLEEAKPFAVGSELIHSATLLHDDVIDRGEVRRGKPTANLEYGNTLTVLAGDFLVSFVMEKLLELDAIEPVRHLAVTMRRLVEGEFLQREYAGNVELTTDQYIQVAKLKTSSLFSFSAWAGSYLPSHDETLSNHFARFAEALGIAFQIVDDVLDFESSNSGKTALADLKDGTMNLPLIIGLNKNDELRSIVEEHLQTENLSEDSLESIESIIKSTGSLSDARDKAREYSSKARSALDEIPDSEHKEALIEVCEFIPGRLN